jgi:hypothetical protein
MYIGTHDGTRMHLYTLSLPTEGDPYTDYLNGDGHEFTETCKLYLPFQDGGDPNAKKVIRRFDIQADGLSFPIIDTVEDSETEGEVTSTVSAAELTFYANADAGSRIFFEDFEPSRVASEWVLQGTIGASPKATMIPSVDTTSGSQIGIVVVGTCLNQNTDEEGIPINNNICPNLD